MGTDPGAQFYSILFYLLTLEDCRGTTDDWPYFVILNSDAHLNITRLLTSSFMLLNALVMGAK